MDILSVRNFHKRYGSKVAVRDLSLSVKPGCIYGCIGHNGAGKTTLIRAIVGAQPFDGGDIEICGHSIVREPIGAKRELAYVPDNPDIYDFMTGEQYLAYIADIFEVPASARSKRIEELSERLNLTDALYDTISSYSHGMKQKLVIMGALIHNPRLLVLDEPFVGLDPVAAHELKLILRERAKAGCAVFFSSHVLEVVEKLCDELSIIRAGEIVAQGTTEEVRGDDSLEDVFLELIEPAGNGREA